VIEPTRTMVKRQRARHPSVPVPGFPRGAGSRLGLFPMQTGVDGLGTGVRSVEPTFRYHGGRATVEADETSPALSIHQL